VRRGNLHEHSLVVISKAFVGRVSSMRDLPHLELQVQLTLPSDIGQSTFDGDDVLYQKSDSQKMMVRGKWYVAIMNSDLV